MLYRDCATQVTVTQGLRTFDVGYHYMRCRFRHLMTAESRVACTTFVFRGTSPPRAHFPYTRRYA